MPKIEDLIHQRQAVIEEGSRHLERAAEAFKRAEKLDQEITRLFNQARDLFVGSEDKPRAPKATKPKTGRVPGLLGPIQTVMAYYNNQPITQDKLLAALGRNGVEVKGKNPKSTLSAHVSYLVQKGHLVRIEDKVALKQPSGTAAGVH